MEPYLPGSLLSTFVSAGETIGPDLREVNYLLSWMILRRLHDLRGGTGKPNRGPAVSPVHAGPMADLDHVHDEISILYRIHDAVDALPYAVLLRARQLLRCLRTGIVGELADPRDHALTVALLGNCLDLAKRGRLDTNAISCHCA